MHLNLRNLVAWAALAALLAATVWAVSFAPEPAADFTFINGPEVKSIDPANVTGQVEMRVIDCLSEGLTRADPETLVTRGGTAKSWEKSPDGLIYTFHIRHDARWSDGTPFTADDVLYSHRRMLDPAIACEYSYILYMVKNARKYNEGQVAAGDPVEVELNERPPGAAEHARGIVLRGRLVSVTPPFPQEEGDAGDSGGDEKPPQRQYVVEIDGRRRTFSPGDGPDGCAEVNFDFAEVGLKATDQYTYQVTLQNPTAYFLQITSMFPTYPVQKACVEKWGFPTWVKPEYAVTNGPFRLQSRKIREKIRMVKNQYYWGRNEVKINSIDSLVVESNTTALNMYLTGNVDWIPTPPATITKQLVDAHRPDFQPSPEYTLRFFRLNLKRPPLDNPLVRRALNMALDKQQIVESVLRAGELPARSFIPPIIRNYEGYRDFVPAQCGAYDPEEAARLLAQAGYPGGRGLPRIPLLYPSDDNQQMIAELVQRQWKASLGVDVDLQNQEWAAYLAAQTRMDYSIVNSGWIGDYIDPNTFMDMFVTNGPNNQTGWSSPRYDQLIHDAAREGDPHKRLKMFHEAEQILMDEQPVIPIYVAVSRNMARTYVNGFYPNVLDEHPLGRISIDPVERRKVRAAEGLR